MTANTVESFLANLQRSRLLAAEDFKSAADLASSAHYDPQVLARLLTRRSLITSWQAQQLLAGRHSFFLGPYRLLERVGQGRFGIVFRSQHETKRNIVALKVLPAEAMSNPHVAARFEREVRLASKLKHPHIVNAYAAQEVHGIHFLIMEYVPGRTLRQWIQEFGRLPIDWSCEVVRQCALGLDYAAAQGIVHRDIKPSNIMVEAQSTSGRPHAKLLDLGVARAMDENEEARLTKPGHVLGTVDYMAPEQVQNTPGVDTRADIYSLGCTLFHAITGQVPFSGDNWAERMLVRTRSEAPLLSTLRHDLPVGLSELVAQLLARNPAHRISTASAVAAALEPFSRTTDLSPQPYVLTARLDLAAPSDDRVAVLERQLSELTARLAQLERLLESSLDLQLLPLPSNMSKKAS